MHLPTLVEYATQIGANPELLHRLIATAKQSDSTVIRYGAAAVNKNGKIVGTGYNRVARTEAEKAWADKDGLLHSETAALLDAQQKGHALEGLRLFVLPLSPAADPAAPAGHILFRGGDHPPCFSCASCAPHLAKHGVEVNLLHDKLGWVPIPPEAVVEQGEHAVEREKATGRKVRGGDKIPGSSRKEAALDEPGYMFDAAYLADMETITENLSLLQKQLYARLGALEDAFTISWGKGTSGQDEAMAMVVRDILGGDIVRVKFTDHGVTGPHYFNVLPGGERVDFTRRRFSRDVSFLPPLENNTQALLAATLEYLEAEGQKSEGYDYLRSCPETDGHYAQLKAAAVRYLAEKREGGRAVER